jgi:hypothetical protein
MPVAGTIDEQNPVITGKFKRHVLKIESNPRIPGLGTEQDNVSAFYESVRHIRYKQILDNDSVPAALDVRTGYFQEGIRRSQCIHHQ